MRRLLFPLMLAASLWAISGEAAGRKPADFTEAHEMTEEELAAAKERSKSHLNGFDEKMEEKPKPIPWAFIALAGIVFSVASVFMVRSFRNTSKELKQQDAYAGGRHRASED